MSKFKDVCVFDIETKDPYINLLGPGWAYEGVSFLSAGWDRGNGIEYGTDEREFFNNIARARTLVAHNAQYDVGYLVAKGINIKDKLIIDTQLLSFLYCNVIAGGHGLDNLAKQYLNGCKSNEDMGRSAANIMPTCLDLNKGTNLKKAITWSKNNMDLMIKYDALLVKDYCEQDVRLTRDLYELFIPCISLEWIHRLSDLLKKLIYTRLRGVRIDVPGLQRYSLELQAEEGRLLRNLYATTGGVEFNPGSAAQVGEAFNRVGISLPETPSGAPAIAKEVLNKIDHESVQLLLKYKQLNKERTTFVDAYLKLQEHLPNSKRGRLYPSLNVFQAITGRFSSSKPNAQQVPPNIRNFFLPDQDGEKVYELDFSAQENRLQVHYAYAADCPGAAELVSAFKKDPRLDLHQLGADIVGLERKQAKAVNLGITYGMGIKKLAKSLECSEEEAKKIRDSYNKLLPFLNVLNKKCKHKTEEVGYLRTLLGRKTYPDKAYDGQDLSYKMINKLIQGGAADQGIEALTQVGRKNLPLMFPVHDSIVFSTSKEEEAEEIKSIMETCIPLHVPMVVDICSGDTWGDCK